MSDGDKAHPEKPNATFLHQEQSETAATVGKKLYGPSGAMDYLVILSASGGGRTSTVVNAATGDEAAEKALARHPGLKVSYVGPAGVQDTIRLADEAA